MKHLLFTTLFFTFSIGLFAQIFAGKWLGEVNSNDTTFIVKLILSQKNDTISGWIHSSRKESLEIDQTFSPIALEKIGNWIINHNK